MELYAPVWFTVIDKAAHAIGQSQEVTRWADERRRQSRTRRREDAANGRPMESLQGIFATEWARTVLVPRRSGSHGAKRLRADSPAIEASMISAALLTPPFPMASLSRIAASR